jgi:hypothetical protein
MFSKKPKPTTVTHVIELSDESKQLLVALDNDIQALKELTGQVLANSAAIMAQLHTEITAQIPVAPVLPESRESGVEVFADEPRVSRKKRGQNDPVPEDHPERMRLSPFNRRPRTQQIAWLLSDEAFGDGRWHSPYELADRYAGDARERRYLNATINARCRELVEEGKMERRGSHASTRSMFEYRLVAK